jgi:hypothetical protein
MNSHLIWTVLLLCVNLSFGEPTLKDSTSEPSYLAGGEYETPLWSSVGEAITFASGGAIVGFMAGRVVKSVAKYSLLVRRHVSILIVQNLP